MWRDRLYGVYRAPLPSYRVRRGVRFSDREFLDLTRCLDWSASIEELDDTLGGFTP